MNHAVDQEAVLLLAAEFALVHGVGERQHHVEASVAGFGSQRHTRLRPFSSVLVTDYSFGPSGFAAPAAAGAFWVSGGCWDRATINSAIR